MAEGEPPRKKKRKAGGSFCAVGGCSNRSSRDKVSAHSGRDFLRYLKLPADEEQKQIWTLRMKRDLRSWKPGSSTKVCTDHFYLEDFREDDLQRFAALKHTESRIHIRLKPNSVPNTDRMTGNFADPLADRVSRRPPKERVFYDAVSEVEQLEELVVDHNDKEEVSDIEELDIFSSDSSDNEQSDGDCEYEVQSDINTSFSDESQDGDACELNASGDEDEVVVHENVDAFSNNNGWSFVHIPLLLMLFRFCPQCGARNRITRINIFGFAIVISYKCYGILPHDGVWRSSPLMQKRYVCNVLISGAAYLCGISYNSLEAFMSCLSVPYISFRNFYRCNSINLYPIIVDKWSEMRTALLERVSQLGEQIDIAGDGHYDSPGWCAKYCTYSILEIATGAIVDFFVVQKEMYKGDLEKAACKEVLSNLKDSGLSIRNFVSDENTKIAKLMREFFPKITHNYDIWHKARLIKRKLQEMAKKLTNLSDFVTPIVNHFWFSCRNCGGDPKVLVEKFHSCLLHLANKHAWKSDPFEPIKLKLQTERNEKRKKQVTLPSEKLYPMFHAVKKCSHSSKIKHRKQRGLKWLEIESEEFMALFKYFTESRFIKSIQMCRNFLHTGALEVYHNIRLKLLPKRTSYSLYRMIVSSMVTAIEVNSNLVSSDSNRRAFWAYSKSQKKYVSKSRVIRKDYTYRKELLAKMLSYLRSGKQARNIAEMLKDSNYVKRATPKNVTGLSRPTETPLLDQSRFVNRDA